MSETACPPCSDPVAAVEAAWPEDLPQLVGRLEHAKAAALQRLTIPTTTNAAAVPPPAPAPEDRLLTVPEAAALMSVTTDYAYTLARQGKLPTVSLPGLDKGGRSRAGKYVRVRLSSLLAWLKAQERGGWQVAA